MDDFELTLKSGFLEEASGLLADAEQCFLNLESSAGDCSVLEQIFRLAHNLKGSAKAVGFEDLSHFTHQLESLLLKIKKNEIPINSASVDLLLRCNDHVRMMIDGLRADFNAKFESESLLSEIEAMLNGQMPAASEPDAHKTEEAPAADVHAPQFEIAVAPKEAKPAASAQPPSSGGAHAEESIRVSFARLERLLNFVGEMVILQTVLREQATKVDSHTLNRTVDQLGKVTKEVQDISMSLRMVPIKQTFQKMQRIVRDTARALNKEIHFEISGEETEVDKTLLEKIGDPLVHMVRNAVDHGIENAERRAASGKPSTGHIRLSAYHRSGSLIIEVQDDGAGLDAAVLQKKAIEKGIIRPETKLSDKEAHQLIFAPGFSTKAVVTDVSGRGVGMDVVKTNITQLQGEIQIETTIGKGSCFRIILPLTLAIIDSMIIRCAKELFVIPLNHVHESLKPRPEDLHFTTLGEILMLRGENIPLFRLGEVIGLTPPSRRPADGIAIVVRTQSQPFAVLVDDIIGQQQVVIKTLGQEIRHLKGFSGSSILGNGRPALILELHELVIRHQGSNRRAAA